MGHDSDGTQYFFLAQGLRGVAAKAVATKDGPSSN
jgi:hypothetical protein